MGAQEKIHFRQNQKQTQGSKGQMTCLTQLTFGEHPEANTGSPQGVHRSKMGPTASERDRPNPWVARPPTGPNQAHLSPANSHRVPYAGSRWYHLESSPKDPLLEGYIRRRRAPNSTHHKRRQELHSKAKPYLRSA